jgi:uncharacterized membrane protein
MKNPITFAKKIVKKLYQRALRSIAFYPIIISLGLLFLALLTLSLENVGIITEVKKSTSYLFIEDKDTARTILSTLIGGILSLTVFSFTMVMVVLSQASSNFSPRLLPGLVSNKKHQLILGWYIGTLLYCTMILISLGAYELKNSTVGMSTTIAAVLGICCVGLFVSFIHTISSAVQIQNIVGRICKQTAKNMDKLLEVVLSEEIPLKLVRDANFKLVLANKDGYFQGFDIGLLDFDVLTEDLQLVVIPYSCEHIYRGDPLFRTNRPVTKEEEESLYFACTISKDLHDGKHPLLGMIKLMEVAVRAMSPGINDPGTALDVVYKLGPLLEKMIRLPDYTSTHHTAMGLVVIKSNISTSKLLDTVIQPIRLYGKEDSRLIEGLLKVLKYLSTTQNISQEDGQAIGDELKAFEEDIAAFITNTKDKKRILERLTVLN